MKVFLLLIVFISFLYVKNNADAGEVSISEVASGNTVNENTNQCDAILHEYRTLREANIEMADQYAALNGHCGINNATDSEIDSYINSLNCELNDPKTNPATEVTGKSGSKYELNSVLECKTVGSDKDNKVLCNIPSVSCSNDNSVQTFTNVIYLRKGNSCSSISIKDAIKNSFLLK